MTDGKLYVEGEITSDLPAGQQISESELLGKKEETHGKNDLQHRSQTVVEPLALLAGVALAPLCGKGTTYSCTCDACSCLEARLMEQSLQSVHLQFQFFISKADGMQKSLVEGYSDREALATTVPSFLYTCQPYFNNLESTARGTLNENNPLPHSTRVQLLDFSQKLCDRLEKLVLTFANYGHLCLDESEPNSISHFYIGQFQFGNIRLTMFRYCKPTPYLVQVNTGLYKRMRWNVERLKDTGHQQWKDHGKNQKRETEKTEYYFLCCEDVNTAPDSDNQDVANSNNVKMWSIGRWVQVSPDPDTDDINDWIICKIPKGKYERLLYLGNDEPSCSTSTDYLLQLLFSQQKE